MQAVPRPAYAETPPMAHSPRHASARRFSQGTILFWVIAGMMLAALVYVLISGGALAWQRPGNSKLTLSDIPFNGERAYGHLQAICDLGPRISATQGMLRQQEYLTEHFEKLGGKVSLQE